MESLFGDGQDSPAVPPNGPPNAPAALVYSNLTRGSRPGRGILYSFLTHEIAIFALLLLTIPKPLPEEMAPPEQYQMVDLKQPNEVVYLPRIGGGGEGNGRAGGRSGARRRGSSAAAAASSKGFSYPGPQTIISSPPKPTNRIQTILQPGLVNPPALAVPLPLPNVVQMAEAGPAPIIERPKPVPAAAVTSPPPPPPAQPHPETPAPVIPVLPKIQPVTPTPAQPPKLELPSVTPQNPSLVAQAKPPEAPPKPIQKPVEPPPPAPTQFSQMPTHGTDQHNLLVLSPMPAPPDQPIKLPAGEAQGRFVISPEPNTNATVPAPGSQVEKTGASTVGFGNQAGVSASDVVGSGAAVTGNGTGAATGEAGAGTGEPGGGSGEGGTGGRGTGTGTGEGSGAGGSGGGSGRGTGVGTGVGRGSGAGSGTGTGAGAGPGSGAFAGMTIQGGTLTGAAGKSGQHNGTPVPPQSSYSMTILSTGSSGGGLPDYGVFANEQVYTVYINMRQTTDDPAPSWTLQYALLRDAAAQAAAARKPAQDSQGLISPFPVVKETPQFPIGLVFRHLRSMLVVYGVINRDGKLERMHVVQTPSDDLDPPLLEALTKWVFRPAELNGEAVSVKALLGIPLSMPE